MRNAKMKMAEDEDGRGGGGGDLVPFTQTTSRACHVEYALWEARMQWSWLHCEIKYFNRFGCFVYLGKWKSWMGGVGDPAARV